MKKTIFLLVFLVFSSYAFADWVRPECSSMDLYQCIYFLSNGSTINLTDTNNYTSSIGFSGSGTKTLNLARVGMVNLTASFTDIDTTYTNGAGLSLIGTTFSVIDSYFTNLFYQKSEVYNKSESYNQSQVDSFLNLKLNSSDQRFNETSLINSVNSSLTTQINRIDTLNSTKLNITDQRYNETVLINTKLTATANNCSSGYYSRFNGSGFECFNDTVGNNTGWTLVGTTTSSDDYNVNVSGAMFVNATSKNVGIRNTNPTTMLHVGNGTDSKTYTATLAMFQQDGTTSINVRDSLNNVDGMIYCANQTGCIFGTQTNHNLSFSTNDVIKMSILTNGNVGIGTMTPSYTLEIVNTSAGGRTTALALRNGGTTNGTASSIDFFQTTTQVVTARITANRTNKDYSVDTDLLFGTYYNSVLSDKLFLKSKGFVGVGVENPVVKLDVDGSIYTRGIDTPPAGSTGASLRLGYDYTPSYDVIGAELLSYNVSNSSYRPIKIRGSEIRFYPNGVVSKVVINSSGLQVIDNATFNGLSIRNNSGNAELYFPSNNLLITDGSDWILNITQSDNVELNRGNLTVGGLVKVKASNNASQLMCLNVTSAGVVSAYKC